MKNIIATLLLITSVSALAECNNLYPNNKKIEVKDTVELCNSWYVAVYNEGLRSTMFVSEVLDFNYNGQERSNKFKVDKRVKKAVTPAEYTNTGWDKGHLVPAGDATSPKEMEESFLMTNIAPQNPTLNRGQWKKLESYIRNRVAKDKITIHVITGVVLSKDETETDIPVPSHFYKVVFFPNKTEYWVAENNSSSKAIRTTSTKLFSLTKIRFK
jgi:endonuclease G